jgi:metal-dependent amidase/aminoacylase/carboxypeptidase family protein
MRIANTEQGIVHTLHTPEFDIDERALVVGVAMQIKNVLQIAKHHADGGKF